MKLNIYLPPVLWDECQSVFEINDLDFRLLHGGLPEPLVSSELDYSFFAEWVDSYYARDIQELFGIRNRTGFIKLLHLLLRQSGGLLDYTKLAKLSGLSLPTVHAHVEAMSIAHAIALLPPFHGGGRREITRRPKCYGFDTGFVCFVKGWDSIRKDDSGLLWEHLVLDELRAFLPQTNIYYWRNKSNFEIDFVIKGRSENIHALECKINPEQFDGKSLAAFRSIYPNGENFIISPFVKEPYVFRIAGLPVNVSSLANITRRLQK